MKGLLSTGASRAWLGVVSIGIVVVAAVLGLQLIPRLTAGQDVIDAAKPALSDSAVRGEVAGTKLASEVVDLLDPLMTAKGGGAEEVGELVTLIKRATGVSSERARAFLSREAPHTAALLRALPLSGVAEERRELTRFLSSTLNVTPEDLQDQLARSFPRLVQTLSELPSVTGGWYDVPGVEGLTLFDGTKVRTLPGVRRYLRDDLVATAAGERERFQSLAGSGGIGYIPYLLLAVGILVIAFGLLQARRAANYPPSKLAWGVVVVVGVVVMIVVGAAQYFPRLHGAQTLIGKLEPAFEERRVTGTRAGVDLVVQTVRFGDPIATAQGGAAEEVPRLVAFVATQTGLSQRQVRGRLKEAAPRTTALLEAIPLSSIAEEVAHLVGVLSRKLGVGGDQLVRRLRKRTPGLAQSLLAVGPATAGWNAIPGAQGLERFDRDSPVRTLPEFAEYLDDDVIPVLESEQEHFSELADPFPPVDVLAGVVIAVGVLLAIYGMGMMFLVTKPPAAH